MAATMLCLVSINAQNESNYNVETRTLMHSSEGFQKTKTGFIRTFDEQAAWMRFQLRDVHLEDGDRIVLQSLLGDDQEVFTNQHPHYSDPLFEGKLISKIFAGSVSVSLERSSGSQSAFTLEKAWIGTRKVQTKMDRSQCGTTDDRVPFSGLCYVRVRLSDGRWGSGYMISPNYMITAQHVMVQGPWTVERNVPLSDPATGNITFAAADDSFAVPNLNNSTLSPNAVQGDDWAVVFVPDNAQGSPGVNCTPEFNCSFSNTTNGTNLTVEGYGLDFNDNEFNGVLQTHTGPSVATTTANLFRYRADTEGSNSGSPVFDDNNRIVGVHTNGGCQATTPVSGDNSGTLLSNQTFAAAIHQRTGFHVCPLLAVVIDRTGSMTVGSTSVDRCTAAEQRAISTIQDFQNRHPSGRVMVMTFAGNSSNTLTSGYVAPADAINAVNSAGPCSGLTPLADAICTAIDSLEQNAAPGTIKELAFLTDGGENNSFGVCSGPSSVSSTAPYDPGSWHANVRNRALAGDVTVTVDYYGSTVRTIDIETGEQIRALVLDTDFFEELANATGGVYTFFDDSELAVPTLQEWVLILFVISLCALALAFRRRSRLTT